MEQDGRETVREETGYRQWSTGRLKRLANQPSQTMNEDETSNALKKLQEQLPNPLRKCRLRIKATGREFVYAWYVAEEKIKDGAAEFVRWV